MKITLEDIKLSLHNKSCVEHNILVDCDFIDTSEDTQLSLILYVGSDKENYRLLIQCLFMMENYVYETNEETEIVKFAIEPILKVISILDEHYLEKEGLH